MLYLILYLMGAAVAYYVICAAHNYTPILDDSPQTFRHVLLGAVLWPITLANFFLKTKRGLRWKSKVFTLLGDATDYVFKWLVKGYKLLGKITTKTHRF